MLQFFQLSKHFGIQTVLDNVSFEVQSGELVAIIGPSGAGKSTLISLLIGAEKPNVGSIYIDGINIESLSPAQLQMYRRKIGVVFQDFKLLEKKTVFENVAFALEVCGESDREIEHKVHNVLKKVNLTAAENKFPHQLSGGEKQRTAIARALVHSPRLLIADEPTGNLDPENTLEVAQTIKNIHAEDEITVMVTTHDPMFLQELSPRVLHLQHGVITSDQQMQV